MRSEVLDLRFTREERRPIVEMLQRVSLFSGLSRQDVERIANKFVERSFRAGEPMVREGDEGVGFYLIVEGSAEVRRSGKSLSKLGQGNFFGEMTLIDEQPRSADVIAVAQTRCLVLNTFNFSSLIHVYPSIAMKMLRELARRLRTTNQALTE